ncbi:MAG: hypothetical protein KBD94_12950 [Pyrinomonadaceae bacterium]|nr:hypothetical protein [Pyrinomonadaceae bacterium]
MKKLVITALASLMFAFIFSSEADAQTRIKFARGRTSATVSGSLSGGATRTYVLGARNGQVLSGNVSSGNGCVVFSGGATSTSFITRSGNNYVSVTNQCRRVTRYTMTVSINFGSD